MRINEWVLRWAQGPRGFPTASRAQAVLCFLVDKLTLQKFFPFVEGPGPSRAPAARTNVGALPLGRHVDHRGPQFFVDAKGVVHSTSFACGTVVEPCPVRKRFFKGAAFAAAKPAALRILCQLLVDTLVDKSTQRRRTTEIMRWFLPGPQASACRNGTISLLSGLRRGRHLVVGRHAVSDRWA